MSHKVQLSPAASSSPAATQPSPASAGQSLRPAGLPQPMAALRRQDRRAGPATDFRPRLRLARRNRSSRSHHVHIPASSPSPGLEPPRRRSATVRWRAQARQAARTASAHRLSCRASRAAARQPSYRPRLTCDVPRIYLAATSRRPAPPPGAGQRHDHGGASDCAADRAPYWSLLDSESACRAAVLVARPGQHHWATGPH